jgi:8-oxo-dGTP pyrophosphatase MutT (NUDIX family)
MWLFTTQGFFSVVTAEEFGEELQVRARAASDLDRLRESFLPTLGPNVSLPGRDYPWRAFSTRDDFAACLSAMAEAIDYSNFKSAVEHRQGPTRAVVYADVWSAGRKIRDAPDVTPQSGGTVTGAGASGAEHPGSPAGDYGTRDLHREGEWPIAPKPRYGGVIFNRRQEVLLREPRGHFDGYHWTFAKGQAKPGESHLDAALREVAEETGYQANVVSHVPGVFRGSPNGSANYFYVMTADESPAVGRLRETHAVFWAPQPDAEQLISLTTNAAGSKRDLKILEAAYNAYREWRAQASWWGQLFFPEPDGWGLRGDPYTWRELLARLEPRPKPASGAELHELLMNEFAEIVGVGLSEPNSPEAIFRPEFSFGGMSSGSVHLETWRTELMRLLESRGIAALA